MKQSTKRATCLAVLLAALAVPLMVQASEIPNQSGATEVTAFLDTKKGLRLSLDGGFAFEIPVGTKIRGVLTFSKTRERPSESLIAKDFKRHGATLVFDGEEDSLAPQAVVAIGIRRQPRRAGQRFVLAMEYSGECTGKARKHPLDDGGCSHWKVFPTEFDEANERVIARLDSVGGHRLQFGWLPAE